MAATLEMTGSGPDALFRLRGVLDFDAVPGLLAEGQRAFPAGGAVRIDLGGLESVNSAGLALLLEWHNEFRNSGRSMELLNMPANLVNIARISELESVLSLPT